MDTRRRIPPSGRVFIASTGDAWRNEPGAVHRIGALGPATGIEAKSPPTRAW